MNPDFFHPDLVRFAFVVGITVSLLFYDYKHLTTGGIAVPAYLSFAIFSPLLALVVLLIALTSYFFVHQLLPRIFIVSAATKFSLLILSSSGLHLIIDTVILPFFDIEQQQSILRGIGYVVPGLIAHDFSRHGILNACKNIGVTTSIVAAFLLAAVWFLPLTSRLLPSDYWGLYPVDLRLLPLLVFLSLIAWLALARLRNFRCGGFLGGAFLALLVMQPIELLMFLVTAGLTLLFVNHCLVPHAILFGRRKFGAYLLVGAALSWGLYLIRESILGEVTLSVATPSLAVISVLLTGLIASDFDNAGIKKTLVGIVISSAFTLSGILLIAELLTYRHPEIVFPYLMLFACLAIGLLIRPGSDHVAEVHQPGSQAPG